MAQLAAMFLLVFAWLQCVAVAATAKLPAGTHLALQLQHHITSSQTPGGSLIYFRVRDDLLAQGRAVVRKGTLVTGKMDVVTERGTLASAGSLTFGIRFVPAVDGQNIRIISSMSRTARSRDGALIGWTLFWGFPGLFTRGVDAYVMRGTELDGEVLSDKAIEVPDTDDAVATPAATQTRVVRIANHSFAGARGRPVTVSLERARNLSALAFELPTLVDPDLDAARIKSAKLVSVNGQQIPEDITAASSVQNKLTFDTWSVLKYCDTGTNTLDILLELDGGDAVTASYDLPVQLIRKAPK